MVILCGGLATRLGSLAENTPKSMIQINGKPFLEYQIDELKKHGVKDIVLCVGHLSEKIESYFENGTKHGVKIKYSYDKDKPLGPIGALKSAEKLLDAIFFTMYGDSYLSIDYQKVYEEFTEKNKLAMMTVYQNFDKYDKSNIILDGNFIKQYGEQKTKDMTYIDYGSSIFNKKVLDLIPSNSVYSTKDLYTNLVEKKELLAYKVDKRFYHIGNLRSLEEFKRYIKS